MNKIFLFAFLLLFATDLRAQTYVPFPTSNVLWTERLGKGEQQGPEYYCFGLKNSDTTINSVSYHKLYRSADTVLTESEFYGGLREDAKKIYLFEAGAERLIYDFNLNIGDTFRNTNPGPDGVVSAIDSVNIGGQYRKRYSFTLVGAGAPYFGNWIEGIGNSGIGGLVQVFAMQPTCDCQIDNLCFKDGNAWIYHNQKYSSTNCVSSGLSLTNPAIRKHVALIVPNPVSGTSRLQVEDDVTFDRMDVYNSRGLQVRTYVVSGKKMVAIDKKEYTPGLYLYRLSASGRLAGTGKFTVE